MSKNVFISTKIDVDTNEKLDIITAQSRLILGKKVPKYEMLEIIIKSYISKLNKKGLVI